MPHPTVHDQAAARSDTPPEFFLQAGLHVSFAFSDILSEFILLRSQVIKVSCDEQNYIPFFHKWQCTWRICRASMLSVMN
jgi:hypothetical protein